MVTFIKRWALPLGAVFVLLGAVGIQLVAKMKPVPEGTLVSPLEELIPAEMSGWEIEDLDLGPTESVTERSYQLLQLDDFVHRSYKRGDIRFSVYVAYWKPGKMPVRLVNQHSPDRCWTEVGFKCIDREWNVLRSVDGETLQPAQWGVYELGDTKQYAYFWHIVGGEAHWYGGERINTRSSVSSLWEDFRKFGLNVHREQFFIRIVSPEPMDGLWEVEGFQEIMADLAALCLAEPGELSEVAVK